MIKEIMERLVGMNGLHLAGAIVIYFGIMYILRSRGNLKHEEM